MLKLITLFDNNTPYFDEIEALFLTNDVKKFFPCYDRLIDKISACHGHFFVVTYDSEFIGALYLDKWGDDSCYLSGFSKRKNPHTVKAVKLLVKTTFEDYPFIKKIYAEIQKENKPAQLAIRRAGFKLTEKEILFKIERFYHCVRERRTNN